MRGLALGFATIAARASGLVVPALLIPYEHKHRWRAELLFLSAAALCGVAAFLLLRGTLLGYITARYFGLQVPGRTYGVLYAAVLAGSALSPIDYDRVADLPGGYRPALFESAAPLGSAVILLLGLAQLPGRQSLWEVASAWS